MDANETPEQACIREVQEETGLIVQELELLHETDKKYTYYVKSFEGTISLDKTLRENEDILELKWIGVNEYDYFDSYTRPMLELLSSKIAGRIEL
nr:NUDIX domain-containing protein [Paenibacillus mesophilus]